MAQPISARPFLSVVMPVYNRARYVAEAIQSILAQTYSHFEFLIVDDGSTDDSPRLIREWEARDARIRPIFLEHGGVSRAMNAGVAQARGELVARMDSDDIALPQRFAAQIEWMRSHEIDVCGSCMYCFGSEARPMWFPETHQAIRHELLFRVGMLFPTIMLRTEIYQAQPIVERIHFDDYELCAQVAPHYRMGNVPQLLIKYRLHDQQSGTMNRSTFIAEAETIRRRCFDDLFPDAPPEVWARHMRIIAKKPFATRAELQRAGEWLARLAQPPDGFLRKRMALRWQAACRASVSNVAECYAIYREWLAKIDPDAEGADLEL